MAPGAICERRDRNKHRPQQPPRHELKCSGSSRLDHLRDAARLTLDALKQSATLPANQVSNVRAFKCGSCLVDAPKHAVLIEDEDPITERIESRFPLHLAMRYELEQLGAFERDHYLVCGGANYFNFIRRPPARAGLHYGGDYQPSPVLVRKPCRHE